MCAVEVMQCAVEVISVHCGGNAVCRGHNVLLRA